MMDDPKTVVLDISSDEEVGWGETRGGCDSAGDVDYDWISELFDGVDKKTEDSDDVVVVGEMVLNPKQRLKSSGVVAGSIAKDEDDDCVVLDGDPDKPMAIENDSGADSDDLLVVSEKGQVACRDYPHPRHLCVKFPFTSTPHDRHCDQCHCYVCDSLAPCIHWGTGVSGVDHCHATDKEELWKVKRKSSKNGDKALPPISGVPDASLSAGILHMNLVTPLTPLDPNPVPQIEICRPALVRPSTSTNFYTPNTISQGRSQRTGYGAPRDKFHPYLVSEQLLRTSNNGNPRDRRHNFDKFGPQLISPRAMLKRTGSVGLANRSGYSSANNNYGSQYPRNPSSVTTLSDHNPIRCQDFRSFMTTASNRYQSSSQPNTGSIAAITVPSQSTLSSQLNMGNMFANSVPSRPQVSSQPYVCAIFPNSMSSQSQVSSQSNSGSNYINLVSPHSQVVSSQSQLSSQPDVGCTHAISVSSQLHVSSQSIVGSYPNAMPSQHQVYIQPDSGSQVSQNAFPLENQTPSAVDPGFTSTNLGWVTPTSLSNQHLEENSQLHSVTSIDHLSLETEFDPLFVGSTNSGSLEFDFESWISENEQVSGPPGFNVLSPEPAPLDAGGFFDF
ncbi:unnamed protein product [Ilex paraguariensis]|uniref:Uncharacterized protein n=1 Tax=Ilex paraguariensis TaxID=185542 RepID=A0ABC8QRK1_9AQUA